LKELDSVAEGAIADRVVGETPFERKRNQK
jgi:hypothetical protein